jgi:hypothetical protein
MSCTHTHTHTHIAHTRRRLDDCPALPPGDTPAGATERAAAKEACLRQAPCWRCGEEGHRAAECQSTAAECQSSAAAPAAGARAKRPPRRAPPAVSIDLSAAVANAKVPSPPFVTWTEVLLGAVQAPEGAKQLRVVPYRKTTDKAMMDSSHRKCSWVIAAR